MSGHFHAHAILEMLLTGIDQGVLLTTVDGKVLFANEAIRHLLEIPADEPIVSLGQVGGINLKLVITRALIDQGFNDAVSRRHQGVIEFSRWLDLPSGRRCFQIRTGLFVREKEVTVRLVLVRDITEIAKLREQQEAADYSGFVTRDPRMRALLNQLRQAAPTEACILLQGESGTGKNLLARLVHRLSPRAAHPFVEVNCAAIPSELLESEFFGHVKGAFTGATSSRSGRFLAAHQGTLFLDEIGEVPLYLQAKFLKAVQERTFEPVGSDKSLTVNVRIVSASNRNLKDAVEARQFRADLYYRLSVVTLHIPPLRERKADIALLIDHFLNKLVARGYARAVLAPEALRLLLDYPWPGNVRELENVLEHALICAVDGVIQRESLPADLREFDQRSLTSAATPSDAVDSDHRLRGQILFALKRTNGNKTAAAKLLGIDRTTLWRRMRRLGIT